ncbi:hypothetical protein ACFOW6_09440 [Fodinicurvata halophila]|uniref:Uncharacterized protein n=1 Tax=Fodinicurvata halophila TaxID=1419723 RepID=A0ABV8UMS6_9PROT
MNSDLTPAQAPIVRQQTWAEGIGLFILYAGIALTLKLLDVSLDTALLTMLVAGFTMNAIHQVSCAMTRNVHLAEIRDLLEKQNRTLDQWRQEQG